MLNVVSASFVESLFLKTFLDFENISYFCNQVLANRREATLLRQKAAVE